MSDYIIGGWTQSPSSVPPEGFSHTMYGMITNLEGLTAGTAASPGWSPKSRQAPEVPTGDAMWTYGGGLCSPNAMPATSDQVQEIVSVTKDQGWAGVDFDDECSMDIDNLIETMQQLKPLQTSYTFLAGADYCYPRSSSGQKINDAVQKINNAGAADRYMLMCYAAAMWDQQTIETYVNKAVDRTINENGVAKKDCILCLTPAGLDDWNLNYFLDTVTHYDIGGLFIWNFPTLKPEDLDTIKSRLDIS